MAKSKYETVLLPNKKKIKKMLSAGMTDKQIYTKLGVSSSTWFKFKKECSEFSEFLKKCDSEIVENRTSDEYIEKHKKTVEELYDSLLDMSKSKIITLKSTRKFVDDCGNRKIEETVSEKYIPADVKAITILLNSYDRTFIKDRSLYELKKEELCLKREMAKSTCFNLEDFKFNFEKEDENNENNENK